MFEPEESEESGAIGSPHPVSDHDELSARATNRSTQVDAGSA
jgi:hypothetical protein